jgi:hypothetical protein
MSLSSAKEKHGKEIMLRERKEKKRGERRSTYQGLWKSDL